MWLDDTLIAVLSEHDGSGYQFVETDHLGTPRVIVHPTRDMAVWRWGLSETTFGEHAANADPDADGVALAFNLRYSGQYFDAESRLHYNYFRDYEPSTGRYVESDPIGLYGGISTYGYAFQSPIKWSDPSGLRVQRCCRPADLPPPLSRTDHCWILTDRFESGMGPARGGVPAQNSEFDLPGDPTTTNDHSGQHRADNSTCEDVPDVDEECVDNLIEPGKELGGFSPGNNCQTFAASVLNSCTVAESPRQEGMQECLTQCSMVFGYSVCNLMCRK